MQVEPISENQLIREETPSVVDIWNFACWSDDQY